MDIPSERNQIKCEINAVLLSLCLDSSQRQALLPYPYLWTCYCPSTLLTTHNTVPKQHQHLAFSLSRIRGGVTFEQEEEKPTLEVRGLEKERNQSLLPWREKIISLISPCHNQLWKGRCRRKSWKQASLKETS